ncbi:unnamed protein product [Spirodela intermedia]|uniref:Uncharacterized protein n=1 Tax=Spirodela intermedia TaxID=51605 RepID=A0A7I8JGV0_SPIIN|nr:unnamed protein product [Spirodela intermedia]CAA6669171.1 unnamed protein product [Spirodela intermedia]
MNEFYVILSADFLVKKKVNFFLQTLNKITVKNKYSMLNVEDMFN